MVTNINQTQKKRYFHKSYITEGRWNSYFHQIDIVQKLRPQSILEIGPGPKVVYDHLKKIGYRIKSVDISEGVRPDFIGDVRKLEFLDSSFDLIMAYQILEHLPFNDFKIALKELWRVSRRYCAISLPYHAINFAFHIELPLIRKKRGILRLPSPRKLIETSEHKWEIGRPGFSIRKIRKIIRNSGFHIIEERVPIHLLWHNFFVLKKI